MAPPHFRAAAAALLLAGLAAGNSIGMPLCQNAPNHGFPAVPLVAGTTLKLTTSSGAAVTAYTPGTTYKLTLTAPATKPIRGFIAAVFPGSSAPSSFGNAKAGALTPTDAKAQVQAQCAGGVTHVSNADKSSITWNWTPPAGGGTVTAHAIVVYQLDQYTTLDLTVPQASPTPTRTKSASRSRTRTASRTRSRTASATRKIKL